MLCFGLSPHFQIANIMFESINPYTLSPLSNYPKWKPDRLGSAIGKAEKAFEKWRQVPIDERAQCASALGAVLRSQRNALARLATLEMGKPITQAEAEVDKCAWLCDHYAKESANYLSDEVIATEAAKSWVAYEPMGAILGVMPWNFPYWQAIRFALPTLIAGNVVLLKHASNVQGCAEAIERICMEAGFPKHCYTNLPIDSKLVKQVIKHPGVRAVSLTGSEAAGASVAKIAGAAIKPSLLELGGSNSFIVLADADLEASAELAFKSRMQNNGQSCIAAKRFIVEKKVEKDFKELLLHKMQSVKSGDPLDHSVYLGPLARPDLAKELYQQLKKSLKLGAVSLIHGKPEGAFFPAALLDKVQPGMPAFDEETFGPLAAISSAENENKAIWLANCSTFGLGATICSKDVHKAMELGKQLKDGAVFINEIVKSDPRLPFGGVGVSGYGRELGKSGIRAFTNLKTYYSA